MPMYDIYNSRRVKVDTIHAVQARHALADFLTRGYTTMRPAAVKARRLEIIRNANQPSTRGGATYGELTAVRVPDEHV